MVEPSQRLENVRASLDVYARDNLETIESLTVQWDGAAGTGSGVDEFIVPRILTTVPAHFHRQTSGSLNGQTRSVLYQISCFLRYGSETNLRRLEEIRDAVAQYFTVGTSIPLKDYFSSPGSPVTDQQLRIHEVVTDRGIPVDENGYLQWVLAWEITYLEEW